MPCALVEKAVFGLQRICQCVLRYKENLADELLRSLHFVLKLNDRVAHTYCEHITQEVTRLVKANATHIRSQMRCHTIINLLSITARHPDASETGFDALIFIMSQGVHLSPANYILRVDTSRQFAKARHGQAERSLHALNLMAGSISCLSRWSHETKGEEAAEKVFRDIGEMWLRLVQGLRKVCLDMREECFDMVVFTLLDDLLEISQNHFTKDYRNIEGTLVLAMKLLSKVFLKLLHDLSQLTTFCKLWLGVLTSMEKYMKAKIKG
ncbi:hypothetical protein GIB67_016425 [Kingdonia uniflora]|uniref:Uncharacterized protein n=1 Tax=Kingdonia uniflora TaxID=39325 RepID=A0A7J7MGZ7_9MAGN|nr:hypothetical protein GIB67_016425 [Kingdonia uniflora]